MKAHVAFFSLFLLFPLTVRGGDGDVITHLLQLPIPERLEFCGEPVPLDREDVLERLDMELVVALGSPVTAALWFKRIPRYFPMIEQAIREKGLPEDLKYVALIESNLRADAVSSAGAVGPWQFIPSTGTLCGLDKTASCDERRAWEEATRAALGHLADLRASCGSWALALAGYNAGPGRVAKAMESQRQNDFFGLRLPRETERYVFRAMAAKLVVENPNAYGINLEGARLYKPEATVERKVSVQHRLYVAAVAKAAGVSYRRLVELNPWIVGQELARGQYSIKIPAHAESGFDARLSRWEAEAPREPKSKKVVRYKVRRDDTLTAIARRHSVQLKDLCAWNGLSAKSLLRPGQELVVNSTN